REYLLAIKEGQFEYDDLLTEAEALRNELPGLYQQSDLPDEPNIEAINQLVIEMRIAWYHLNPSSGT
ncbi:MAG: nucleotidyltransferase, partial [Chitinophagaceae bacterium]|nr:nucleotidyltransferase [Chitinophagaceae bacterium]